MPETVNRPRNLRLNNVEYLLIKIAANPGQSQRFFRKALYNYRNGFQSYNTGDSYGQYFRVLNRWEKQRYMNVLWKDVAPKDVADPMVSPWGIRGKMKPKRSQIFLTNVGYRRLGEVRRKLGI